MSEWLEAEQILKSTFSSTARRKLRALCLYLKPSLGLILVLASLTSWGFGQGWLNDSVTLGLTLIAAGLLLVRLLSSFWQPFDDNLPVSAKPD